MRSNRAATERSLRVGCTSPKRTARSAPLGIAALEDKIVQQAMVMVLTAIYEVDFLGFSYGFRPDADSTMRWT